MADKFFTSNFNAKSITDFLNAQVKALKDLTPLMKTARVCLKQTVDENFETKGQHTGKKWKEWSDAYKKQRIKMGKSGGKILALSGDLRRSIMAKHGKDYALVGTAMKYAAVHNFGINKKVKKKSKSGKLFTAKMKMPQREFMRLDDNAIDDLYSELYIKAQELLFFH